MVTRTTLALALVVAGLGAPAAPAGALAPTAVTGPPSATVTQVALVPAVSGGRAAAVTGDAVTGDAATLAQGVVEGAARVTTDVVEQPAFESVGVTWAQGADAAALDPRVRTRAADGTWSAWHALPVSDEAPEAGSADAGSPEAARAPRAGTDPLWVGESDAVQVSFAPGAALPADLRVALVDAPAAPAGQVLAEAQAPGAPAIISRATWGARPQVCQPDVAKSLVGAVVHHTADPNDYATVDDAMRRLRADQAYHIDGRGWCDLGYNFVVDKWGNLYEGRAGSLAAPVVGVHAGGFNTGTVGVSMLGTYDQAPSAATQHTVAQIIGYRLGYYGVDPSGTMTYHTYGGENSRYGDAILNLPRVIGHRDVAYTACPGNGGYAALPGIRAEASSYSYAERFRQSRAVVQALYQDLLGRAVDPGGLDSWSSALLGGSQPALVLSLTSSDEYIRVRITAAYQAALGRDPDPSGLAYWTQRIKAGSATVDDVLRRFYDSDEYVRRAGGTMTGYVSLLYQTMFDRPATDAEAAWWAAWGNQRGRSAMVDTIWFSFEAAQFRAARYYRVFLDREADAAGAASWGAVLLAQGEGAVRAGIAGSEEYRRLALATYP